jgi:hypothetical protein
MNPTPEQEDFHAILGVSPHATPAEIKAAYRARAKSLHPDLNPDADTTAEFLRVKRAYAALVSARTRPRPEVPAPTPHAATARPRPRATRSVTRPLRAYGLAAGVLLGAAAAALWVFTHSPAPVRPEVVFEQTMEVDVARQARALYTAPPEPATVEVAGREGRKHQLSRAAHKKIEPLQDRLNQERTLLERRRSELQRRKTALEAAKRDIELGRGTGVTEFQLKFDAYQRDVQAFMRDGEQHLKDVDQYFTQLERLAKEQG